jgi:Uma2 family endonuclease
MAEPASKTATYEDLAEVPSHMVGEIIGGELRMQPRPGPRHARAASRLGASLDGPFDRGVGGPGGWWLLDEPELHLGREIVVPDLSGWRVDQMPELPDTAYFEQAPNWICEVLSPSTAADDRADKMPIYAAAGVDHAWLIDPLLRTLEVYRRRERQWLLVRTHRGDETASIEPFNQVPLELGMLWAPPKRAG